jgi:ribonuclease HI/pterin-4a-carbinolamine dehydratase
MWQEKNGTLYRNFIFRDFKDAFNFMQSVAVEAEKLQHHPRWENSYNRVEIWLSTHEADDTISEKDRTLADAIDKVYEKKEVDKNDDKNTTKLTDIKIYTDGGSRGNPGPSASGFVILSMDDKILVERGIYLGITTNNQAEYKALKFALEEAQTMHVKRVDVYMDSLLIVSQMTGKFKVKSSDLIDVHNAIKHLAMTFEHVSYTHVPRALNKRADAMVNWALDEQLKV